MPPLPNRIDCIDVHEGENVDWRRVAEQGVSIAIVKAHENGFRRDASFHANWPAMRNAGLIRGAFQYYNPRPVPADQVPAETKRQVEAAAEEFLQIVRDAGGLEPGDLPLVFDLEKDRGVNQAGLRDQAAWWLCYVRDAMRRDTGRTDIAPMIYSGNFWREAVGNPTTHTTPDGITVNFADFPFWLAGYPRDRTDGNENCTAFNTCDPDDTAALRDGSFSARSGAPLVPSAWWNSPWILWQFTHCARMDGVPPTVQGLDASVIVTLAARRNASGVVDGANMQHSTDLRPLLSLAGIAPPQQPRELTRVQGLSDGPPEETFNVLVIGQGFWPGEIDTLVDQMLYGRRHTGPGSVAAPGVGVLDVPPLNLLGQPGFARRVAIYRDAGGGNGNTEGLFLRLNQTDVGPGQPAKLALSTVGPQPPQLPPAVSTLELYIASLRVRRPDGSLLEADRIWRPRERRTGPNGSLVVVLRKPQLTWSPGAGGNDTPNALAAGELYQLEPSEESPVPFVAVNAAAGNNWPLLVARALAQNLAGLADEFELEGDGFAKAPPGALQPAAPNLVYFDDAHRARLVGG
jgi:GH25 family lysozyme M1 (1,4-beta-N-acetylmuramidase)